MDILNKDKLKQVLQRWRGHPSVTDLLDKFTKLQSYTKKRIKESKYELVELNPIIITTLYTIQVLRKIKKF